MIRAMVLIIMGVSGSGKTEVGRQVAQALQWPFADGDDFHPLANIDKMRRGIPLTDEDRQPWLDALQRLIQQSLDQGQSMVLACSALRQRYRDHLQISPAVHLVYLKGDYTLIHQRLRQRTHHFMGADLLQSQWQTLEEPRDALVVVVNQPIETIVGQIQTYAHENLDGPNP